MELGVRPSKKWRGVYTCTPTFYNQVRYRSKTEAQWAVFFDTLGIPFQYEPRKFDFGDFRYIPDFYLPDLGIWIEIKGPGPTDEQIAKIKQVAEATGESAFLFFGLVRSADEDGNYAFGYIHRNPIAGTHGLYGDHLFAWARCPRCKTFDVALLGRADYLPCHCLARAGKLYGDEDLDLRAAFDTASNAFQKEAE